MEQTASMEKNDKSLIDAHCQGDLSAFGEIVRRYGGGLLGYLIRMCGNRELAEDCFQETFKRVHEKAHTFRGERLKPWLFTIATHIAIDGFRKQSRLKIMSLNRQNNTADGGGEPRLAASAEDSHDPANKALKAERKEHVRRAIGCLPTRQRATLVLAYYQQLSYQEVATALDCSIGTVKTQMYRALRALAQKLPEFGGETK